MRQKRANEVVYLDNAATTQVAPACVQTVSEVLATHFANPSSLYGIGLESQKVLERARGVLAKAMGCRPDEVIFTGSGTEVNNLAVLGLARARRGWGTRLSRAAMSIRVLRMRCVLWRRRALLCGG